MGAASLALDGCAPINNLVDDAKWNIDQVLKINNSILMELFEEESQSDQSDFERLDDVIRSLEAEINPYDQIDCESSTGELEYLIDSSTEDEGSPNSWQGDWLESSDHSEGVIWCMEDYADEMNCVIDQFDSVTAYPIMSLLEEAESYGSLWHETFNQAMDVN